MKKLLVFDLDGTLCDINSAIQKDLLHVLKRLSYKHQIVFSSGKPFGYVAGFARQLKIHNLIIIGENGGTIMYDSNFPPKNHYKVEIKKEVRELFNRIKNNYIEEYNNNIWFQPNEVNLTVFPTDINRIKEIHKRAEIYQSANIQIYYHKDSVDFVQRGFDKGTAIDVLLGDLPFNKSQLYVFGDGSNDIPMLRKTNNSISIGNNKLECNIELEDYKQLRNYLISNF